MASRLMFRVAKTHSIRRVGLAFKLTEFNVKTSIVNTELPTSWQAFGGKCQNDNIIIIIEIYWANKCSVSQTKCDLNNENIPHEWKR